MADKIEEKEEYTLEQNDFFIKKTAGRFIINSIISMVFLYIGSLIDTLLVGMYLSEEGLAAMSLVSPVYLIFYTVGATIGIGGSIIASRVLGQGRIDEYQKVFTASSLLMGIVALAMVVLGYVFVEPVMKILCGSVSGAEAELAKTYFLFYIPGGAATLISYIPLYFLKIEGKPKISSRLFTMSAIINVVFSWLFISPIGNMGIAGAALATSLSFVAVAILGFILMLRGRTELRFVSDSLKMGRIKEMLLAGIPNGVSNLLESLRILLINLLLIYSGAAAMLTCYTVVRNVNDILNSVIIGISSALMPLIGVFYGERDYVDERIIMKRSMRLGIIVMGALTILVFIIPKPLCLMFGVNDPLIIKEGMWAIPLSCIGLVAAYANTQYTNYLTSINREWIATTLVVLRLFAMLAIFAIPLAFTVGSIGIWASLSLTEIGTFVAFCIIRNVIRKKQPSLDKYLLDTEKEKGVDITFAVKNDVQEIVDASQKISSFLEDNEVDMKRVMKVGLAIEEILTFLLTHCIGEEKENYVAVRVCKIENEVMVRFRYIGTIYNPLEYYNDNEDNEELAEELLGLKMMTKSAQLINFQQTLGTNNLMLVF